MLTARSVLPATLTLAAMFAAASCSSESTDGNGGGSSSAGGASNTGGSSASPGAGGSGAVVGSGGSGAVTTGGTGPGIGVGTGAEGGTMSGDGGLDDLRDASCAGWVVEPESAPAVVQMVVDTSLSMNDPPPGGQELRSKWTITSTALLDAIAAFPAQTGAGVLFYPNRDLGNPGTEPSDITECVNTSALIPVAELGEAGSAQRASIESGFAAVEPNGWTPTHDAYTYALMNGLLTSTVVGQRYMLLITDGQPTLSQDCVTSGSFAEMGVPPEPIIQTIAEANAQGIRTFVIGSPGSEVGDGGEDMRPWLSQAAREGGTAPADCSDAGPNFCHFDMTQEQDFATALRDTLEAIAGTIVACNYALPEPGSGQTLDLDKINAVFTPAGGQPEYIGRVAAGAACEEGWQLSGDQVVLCPSTCERIQADRTAGFELLFGCESVTVVE